MNDALLRVFSGSISVTGAQTQQAGVFAGRNRTYNAVARVGGDVTGTGPTLSYTLEESSLLASGYAQVPGTGTINVTETAQATSSADGPGNLLSLIHSTASALMVSPCDLPSIWMCPRG